MTQQQRVTPRLPWTKRRRATRRRAVQAWRARQVDNCRCVICGQPMPEDDLRTGCAACRRRHNARMAYSRWFAGLFS